MLHLLLLRGPVQPHPLLALLLLLFCWCWLVLLLFPSWACPWSLV
jgi:hypothetical protein